MEWLLLSWPMLILAGLGLRMAIRLTYGARGADQDDPIYVLLIVTSWVLIGLGITPAAFGALVTVIGTVLLLLALATVIEAILQRRAAERRSICTMLSLLIERGAELESSMLTAGNSYRGIVGRTARRLFDALQCGVPLTSAVVKYPGALPAEASAYLAVAGTSAARSRALRELSRSERGELAAIWRTCVDRIAYLFALVVCMCAILSFVMIKIVPEFAKIFDEFDLDLPPMTELAVSLSSFASQHLLFPVFSVIVVGCVGSLVVAVCYLSDVPIMSWLGDWLFRGRRKADLLRIIAIAVDQREPLAEAFARIAMHHPSSLIRRRLLAAARAMELGTDWRDTLLRSRLISQADCSLLHTAERVGNVPWALRAIARRCEKRTTYGITVALNLLYPLTILALGFVVAFFVIALFIPIIKLIEGMAV